MTEITLYAAGEIHSDWRDELRIHLARLGVDVRVVGPQEVHDRSDALGEDILPKSRQWNTAMDAGFALAPDVPLILVRDPEHTHALKEIDALAFFTAETLEQAAEAVTYIFE